MIAADAVRRLEGTLVVDDDGAPLVVYRGEHGDNQGLSGDRLFQSRLGSISFGSAEAASFYAEEPNNRNDRPVAPRVYPAFLSITNPIIHNLDDPFIDLRALEAAMSREHALRIACKFGHAVQNTNCWEEMAAELGVVCVEEAVQDHPDRLLEAYFDVFYLLDDPDEVRLLKEHGFDGAIHMGNGETADELEYRIFDESQAISVFDQGVLERPVNGQGRLRNNNLDMPRMGF
jgi:hypothetical protein